MTKLVSEILNKVALYDQSVLDLLQERYEGYTLIQISDRLKRSRLAVYESIVRLKISKHIHNRDGYGRLSLVEYDFSEQIASKRPDEAVSKIKSLQSKVDDLELILGQVVGTSKRIIEPALSLAIHDYPMSSTPKMARTDWSTLINKIKGKLDD